MPEDNEDPKDSPYDVEQRRYLEGDLARATGRHYRVNVDRLNGESCSELRRLIRDLKDEIEHVKRQARTQPWKFGFH